MGLVPQQPCQLPVPPRRESQALTTTWPFPVSGLFTHQKRWFLRPVSFSHWKTDHLIRTLWGQAWLPSRSWGTGAPAACSPVFSGRTLAS